MLRLAVAAAVLLVAAPAAAQDSAARELRMIALYGELCLGAFPDDEAVDAFMAARGARPLTPEEVRVTFNDDPGRGWLLDDEGAPIQVMLELPPYHACSVRWMSDDGFEEAGAYRAAIDAYQQGQAGWVAQAPYEAEVQGLAIRAMSEQRELPGGYVEALMTVEQRVIDPARRKRGETRVSVRFVHQIVSPDAP